MGNNLLDGLHSSLILLDGLYPSLCSCVLSGLVFDIFKGWIYPYDLASFQLDGLHPSLCSCVLSGLVFDIFTGWIISVANYGWVGNSKFTSCL